MQSIEVIFQVLEAIAILIAFQMNWPSPSSPVQSSTVRRPGAQRFPSSHLRRFVGPGDYIYHKGNLEPALASLEGATRAVPSSVLTAPGADRARVCHGWEDGRFPHGAVWVFYSMVVTNS